VMEKGNDKDKITVKVFRFDPSVDDEPRYELYDVPYEPGMRVMDALLHIFRNHTNLGFRYGCTWSRCGSCAVNVNGEPALACARKAEDGMTVEPLKNFPIVRDLIINFDEYNKKRSMIRPFIQRSKPLVETYDLIPSAKLENLKDVSWCTRCLACVAACPVFEELRWKGYGGPAILNEVARWKFDPRDDGPRLRVAFDEGLFKCTSCNICKEVCPFEISTPDFVAERLRAIAVEDGLYLGKHKKNVESVRSYGNPYLEPPEKRTSWLTYVHPSNDATVLLWLGCTPSYRVQNMATATVDVLNKLAVPYAYLGNNERCCGSFLLRTGFRDDFMTEARANIEAFRRTGVDTIVTSCAGCYRTFKKDYPVIFNDFNFRVLHISELLAEKLKESNIRLSRSWNLKLAYHDPCHLARHVGVYEPPREIIRRLPGVQLVETGKSRRYSRCCGAGGGVMSGYPEIASVIASKRIKDMLQVGAEAIVSACPFCELNLTKTISDFGTNMKVYDLTELVAKALQDS